MSSIQPVSPGGVGNVAGPIQSVPPPLSPPSPPPPVGSAPPAIFYNGKTIQFPFLPYYVQLEYPRTRIANRSASKVPEILNVSPDDMHSYKFRIFENAQYPDLKRYLYQWWEWALAGNAWSFAFDSSRTVKTTLNGAVSSGSSSCIVTSNTGITIGKQYVIRSKTQQQLVKVSNVVGTIVSFTETVDFAFDSGSRFRDELYWPALLYVPGNGNQAPQHAVREKPPLTFDVELMFTEDVTTL